MGSFTFGSKLNLSALPLHGRRTNTVYHELLGAKSTDPYNAASINKTYALYTVQKVIWPLRRYRFSCNYRCCIKIAAINGQYYGHLLLDTERASSATVAADGSTTLNVYLDPLAGTC